MLRLGGRNLLLAVKAHKMILHVRVHNEDRLDVVDVLTLQEMSSTIDRRREVPSSDLRQLSLHVEGESAKLLDVDGFSSANVAVNILTQSLPDDHVLSLRLQRLQVGVSALRRVVVLARVLVTSC